MTLNHSQICYLKIKISNILIISVNNQITESLTAITNIYLMILIFTLKK